MGDKAGVERCGWPGSRPPVGVDLGEVLDLVGLGVNDMPIRQTSANGQPPPRTSIERTCRCCKASLLGLAPGMTGERGLWQGWGWWCSQECFDADHGGTS